MTYLRTTIILGCAVFALSVATNVPTAHGKKGLCIGSAGAFCNRQAIAEERCASNGLHLETRMRASMSTY